MERLRTIVLAPSGLEALLRLPPSPNPKLLSITVALSSQKKVGGAYLPLLHRLLFHPASQNLTHLRLSWIHPTKPYREDWETFVDACEEKGIRLTWEDWHVS